MEIINVDESVSLAEMQKAERKLRDVVILALTEFEQKTKTRVKGGLRIKRERDTGLVSDVLLTLDILA